MLKIFENKKEDSPKQKLKQAEFRNITKIPYIEKPSF